MKLDFFSVECQYPPIYDNTFGLCDDQDGTKAYPDKVNPNKWVAKVENESNLEITFTAIDKCVLKDTDFKDRGRCDGMLTTHHHLFLVELKERDSK
jgi:hypothetical protein